ncbi:4756_t:CDS:1, partial [Racocetra fulgida]
MCEKLAAILYYENGHSKNNTATKFNIETKQLWNSKKTTFKNTTRKKKLNKDVSPKYLTLETTL